MINFMKFKVFPKRETFFIGKRQYDCNFHDTFQGVRDLRNEAPLWVLNVPGTLG
tara:strand:- start:790 stop:951 length:162 start_codon:yes stop_codon:yes gene_type:complete